ncbi:MAG: nucleotide exchange factor GrpE [Candidatus Methanomethylophilaceae archaeon]|jgi:molecular chaperone GrpE|nr:nucleotide exchange factor GrpE [Candidatus Methanomethylophilaceae archaeon]NLF33919.1 nucleotide exchange factor GrpE [Thermoplasmatales archaeon]
MTEKSEKKTKKDEAMVKMQEDLDKAKDEAEGYLDMARRLQADFDNYRKRSQRENEEFRRCAEEGVMVEVLGTIDDLDRALENTCEDSEFVSGVRSIRQNLMKILESRGLSEVPTDGKFDPILHEAMCVEETDADGDITEVFQKGYRIGNRVVRYAKVKVTRKKEEESKEGEQKCQE